MHFELLMLLLCFYYTGPFEPSNNI